MYPGYRFMESHPQPRNQMHYPPTYELRFDSVPPQMKMDPSKFPMNNDSWPYVGSYGYPYPMECHGCCHHNQFPGYHGFRPPYPYYAPPPSFCSHGSYPAFSGPYPVHYTPPPHYSVDDPRYEYEKNGARDHHCCGCPNHSCQPKEDRSLRIEEQDPDVNKKNDSLVPFQLRNMPYPIVCIPPGYMMNKEVKKPIDPDSNEGAKSHGDDKDNGTLKSFEREPSVWNGWLPIDISSLGSSKQEGDGKRTQHHENEDKGRNPFPIIWMPYNPDQVERNGQESVKEPSQFKISPVELPDSYERKSQDKAKEEISGCDAGLKMSDKNAQRTIPVKQMEQSEGKKMPRDVEERATEIPVEHLNRKGETKPSGSSANRQSSPPKTSKLPPVCLRVDPLPKRKNNKGGSRSPNPPADNRKSQEQKAQELSHENLQSSTKKEDDQQAMQSPVHLVKREEGEQSKSKTKTVEVIDGTTKKNKREDLNETQIRSPVTVQGDSREMAPTSEITSQAIKGDGEFAGNGGKGARDADDIKYVELSEDKKATVAGRPDDVCTTGGEKGASDSSRAADTKKLSEAEAAVVIQSTFRGFQVRRWEPLKKLREIAKITKQAAEVKGRVQDLESSSNFQIFDKERMVIGEIIMSLLLQLDTIQGLHPSVRESRKSVAKELVSLQEKLDSLAIKNCEESIKELPSVPKSVEDVSRSTHNEACRQDRQEELKHGCDDEISAGNHDVKSELEETCQGHSPAVTDIKVGSIDGGNSELIIGDKEAGRELDEAFADPQVQSSVDFNMAPTEPLIEQNNGRSDEMTTVNQVPVLYEPANHEVLQNEFVKPPLPTVRDEELKPLMEESFSSPPVDLVSTGKDSDTNELVEFPLLIDQNNDAQEFKNGKELDIGHFRMKRGEQVVESDLSSLVNEVTEMNQVEKQPGKSEEPPDISDIKENTGPNEDKEKDDEPLQEAILEAELLEVPEDKEVCDKSVEPYEVEKGFGSVKDAEIFECGGHEMKECKLSLGISNADENAIESNDRDFVHKEYEMPIERVIYDGDDSLELKEISSVHEERKACAEAVEQCIFNQKIEAEEEQETLEKSETMVTGIVEPKIEAEADEEQETLEKSETMVTGIVEQKIEAEAEAEEEQETLEKSGTVTIKDNVVNLHCDFDNSSSQVSSDALEEGNRKLIEENEKLKEMMEKLIEAGKEQLTTISNLSGRVQDLEKKLSRKKKPKLRRYKAPTSRSSSVKTMQ